MKIILNFFKKEKPKIILQNKYYHPGRGSSYYTSEFVKIKRRFLFWSWWEDGVAYHHHLDGHKVYVRELHDFNKRFIDIGYKIG